MEVIVAILFGLCMIGIIFYLVVYKQLGLGYTVAFLVFTVVAGFGIAKLDRIKKVKGLGTELEMYEQRIKSIKDETLMEIEKEVRSHKDSIQLLIASLNETREKTDVQRKAVESLLERSEQQQKSLQDLAGKADSIRNRIEALHKASSDLALLLTKITWLQMETKSEFGTDRSQRAIEQIASNLNRIVDVVIPNPQERRTWIQELQSSLPPK